MEGEPVTGDDEAPPAARPAKGAPERRCIVTRESGERDDLIRFVISPEGEAVPDLSERLPGRGLWLTARGDIVRRACRENSFSKAARRSVKIPADLSDRLDGLFEKRCLDLIGLARRSGHAVAGFEKVRAAAAGGKVALLLEASDGAADGREKIARAAPGSVTLSLWTAEQLGGPFGRDSVVHAAILEGGLADRLLRDARRLEGLRSDGADPGVQLVLQES